MAAKIPNEIWTQIFEQQTDPVELWCHGRAVSKTFLAVIDSIFISKYLPDTSIQRFPRGDNESGTGFYFDRFEDENREIAVFKNKDMTHLLDDDEDRVYQEWRPMSKNEKNILKGELIRYEEKKNFNNPPLMLVIQSAVNDTELPDCRFNPDTEEISCQWKAAFQCFMREQYYINSSVKDLDEELKHIDETLATGTVQERQSKADKMLNGRVTLVKRLKEARRTIRRHRLQKLFPQYTENESSIYTQYMALDYMLQVQETANGKPIAERIVDPHSFWTVVLRDEFRIAGFRNMMQAVAAMRLSASDDEDDETEDDEEEEDEEEEWDDTDEEADGKQEENDTHHAGDH